MTFLKAGIKPCHLSIPRKDFKAWPKWTLKIDRPDSPVWRRGRLSNETVKMDQVLGLSSPCPPWVAHWQLEPSSPNLLILSPLQTCSIPSVCVSGLWDRHSLLPVIPLETRGPSSSLTPKSNASPSPTKVTFCIFPKSVHLSPPHHHLPEPDPSFLAWPSPNQFPFFPSSLPPVLSPY